MKFLVDDIESEWAYEDKPFDFIHARYLAVSIRDFAKLIKQCYRYAMVPPPFSFLANRRQVRKARRLG